MSIHRRVVILALLAGCGDAEPPAQLTEATATPPAGRFTAFESGQVRPLALSADGATLYAVNTPDNRLEILRVRPWGLERAGSVTVGLEPVAVAVRGDAVWVVNHLSDSVSIVDARARRVLRTLLVGDEPRDIVFAGPGGGRAFITTAHRGQNTGRDPQLFTPGVGRADVWIFDAERLGATLGGEPLAVLSLFTDTPRALAVSPDGGRVYAAGFHTGNRTTTVSGLRLNGPGLPGPPPPFENHQGIPAPPSGLIVRFDGSHWVDERGLNFDEDVRFDLPDVDVFAIDATATPPRPVDGGAYAGAGTILFNMVANPATGKLYVSNLDARNHVRFEGHGVLTGERGVQGHLAESRITVIDPASGAVTPRHLNPHIDYTRCCAPLPNEENERSVAFPTGMAVTADGATLYVAALGSSEVAAYATATVEDGSFTPSLADQIPLSGGGPTGLVLDEPRRRLYVMTRFDNAVTVVDTQLRVEVGKLPLHNPEPEHIVRGRRFLYDASLSSSHGDSACASCHIFGDLDSLAWDLGDPDGDVLANPGPFDNDPTQVLGFGGIVDHHPMKGPMATQSLRGMANHGPLHWRGDRSGGNDAPTAQPDSGAYDERAGFIKFNVAFAGLLGRHAPIADADMGAFADFMLDVVYPPNPLRNLDDSDTPGNARARRFFMDVEGSTFLAPATRCNDCHRLDPAHNADFGVAHPGLFGSNGNQSFLFQGQNVKNAHLRNQYQKVGMFGNPEMAAAIIPGDNEHKGPQIRGFGYFHDGSVDTDVRFLSTVLFAQIPGVNPDGIPFTPEGSALRQELADFMLAFPSNLAPIVGQQVTLARGLGEVARPRVDLLEACARAGQCELVAKVTLGGRERGFLYTGAHYLADEAALPPLHPALVRALALLAPVTYTCAPPGSGRRMALDRDADGVLDGDD